MSRGSPWANRNSVAILKLKCQRIIRRDRKIRLFFARSPGTSRWKQGGCFEIMPGKKGTEYMHVHKYIRFLSVSVMAAGNVPEKRAERFFPSD